MSIVRDIRSYADTAVSQGKQVLDQAQAQLIDVTGQANELYGKTRQNVYEIAGKATVAANDLRASAEKAVNFDAIKTAVDPYLVQFQDYRHVVTDRAEVLLAGAKKNERVARIVDAAGSVTGVVVETVQTRVVKPVRSLTGLGANPAAAKSAPRAAATRPASKPAATKPAETKPAASKPATKPAASKPAARKAPAKRADN